MTAHAPLRFTRGAAERHPADDHAVTSPVVLVEVMSPSTDAYDRGEKLRHYKTIPSLREVVLVDHRERLVEVHRPEEDGSWTRHEAGAGGAVRVASLGWRARGGRGVSGWVGGGG